MGGRLRTDLGVAVAIALALAGAATPAGAAAPAAAGLHARETALRPALRLPVTIALRPRDPAALNAYALAVSTPGSAWFRRYLTPAQFSQRFGAGPSQTRRVQDWLRSRGLHPGPVSANGLSIALHASVGQLERGLGVALARVSLPGRRTAVIASGAPRIAAAARPSVQSIVGLDTVPPRPLLVRASPRRAVGRPAAFSPQVSTAGPQPCSQAQAVASAYGAHTADEIASIYGFSGLYQAGDLGAGVTVAIYELEPDLPSDIATYESCYGIVTPVQYVQVDGGAGQGTGSGEAALDIEQLIGMAPAVRVLVYQGPNAASGDPGAGPYDTFAAIVDQDRANVISVSWGECEAELGAADAEAENTLFEEAAVQGQTVVSAAGDSGSEDCDAPDDPQTQLAVDDPASQPFVTGVGGTSLESDGPRPTESVWNSGAIPLTGTTQAGAGGGGISGLWAMPPAQLDAAPSLGVLAPPAGGAPCGNPGGYCREVPDVSADADPATGYVIYWSGAGLGESSGWQAVGGTSAAGPVWAALMALADSGPACAGVPLGFADPALYRAAGSSYAQDFNDVRSGENDFTGTAGGQYAARAGYDEASGLGSPNASSLAPDLCADTLTLLNPGSQRLTEGAAVQLPLRALDRQGTQVGFSASGVPPGLTLDESTGMIAGRPLRTGSFLVSVSAQDDQQAIASESFTITVGDAPRITRATLRDPRGKHPRLSLTVTAGQGAPALSELVLQLPRGLSLRSTRGEALHADGVARPRFHPRLQHGRLTLLLSRPLSQLTLTLNRPGLRAGRWRARSRGRLSLELIDTSGGQIELLSRVRRLGR